MDSLNFDLSYRRKRLRKRKKRRQTITAIVCISLILLPIIFSMKSESNFVATIKKADTTSKDVFTICIDPGHGDWDTGTIGTRGCKEKDIVLNIALKLGKLLSEEEDIKVIYTRTSDSLPWLENANDSLKERIKISNLADANLFISLHCNSNYENTDSKGVETWYNPEFPENQVFASYLQYQLTKLCYTEDRGLKYYETEDDALAVLEKTTATSALVEFGFISNFEDEYYLNSTPGQSACAEALYNGIMNYKENLDNNEKK